MSVFPCFIDMDGFLFNEDKNCEKVISYFMQTDYARLPEHVQLMVKEFVRNMCVGLKKNLLPHSDAVIIVE